MKRRWLAIAMAACILGIACSVISLNSYYKIQKGGVAEESFCAISDLVNCDLVEASSYSSIGSIPIAGLGLLYYVFIFLLAVVARYSMGFKKPTVAFAWWCSVASLFFTAYMAYVSVVLLNVFCLTCVGMYASNILIFVSLYLAMGMPLSDGKNFLWGYPATFFTRKKMGIDFMPKVGIHLLIAAVIFGIGMIFIASASKNIQKLSDEQISEAVENFNRQSGYDLKVDKDSTPLWGTKGAPVTFVEFSDYRCPFCRQAAFMVKPFLTEYKKNVEYYFINYPLDSECNHYVQHQMHPGACLAARAALCANKAGRFWDYHDELFRETGNIDNKLVLKIAGKLNLNTDDFATCLGSAEVDRKLKEDIETARKIYITGTPSIFLNSRYLRFWRSPELLRLLVRKEIEGSKVKK